MGHGSYDRKRAHGWSALSKSSARQQQQRQQKKQGLQAEAKQMKRKPKPKSVSIKNQIRSVERLLKKDLPREVREAQEKRILELKKEADIHAVSELERKMAVRYRKVKFFERRKIERLIRRLERQQRVASDPNIPENSQQAEMITKQLAQLKEDHEYVRFFPKTQKYVSLFVGNDDESVVLRRRILRERIKSNLAAAAAAGVELEETGSDNDLPLDVSEDDFFVYDKGSGNADADDEWIDKSLRLVDKSKHKEKEPVLFSNKPPATRLKDYGSQNSANLVSNSLDGPRKVLNKLSNPGKVEIQKPAKVTCDAFHASKPQANTLHASKPQANTLRFDSHKKIGKATHPKKSAYSRTKMMSSSTSTEIFHNSVNKAGDNQQPASAPTLQERRKRKRSRPKKKKQQ